MFVHALRSSKDQQRPVKQRGEICAEELSQADMGKASSFMI